MKPKRLFLPLVLLCLSFNLYAQDEEVIRVDSSLVVINATVTDARNQPASGLKQDQFTVFEDGKLQEITFFASESAPFAAVILIDTSGSMEQRISLARSAAIQFLDRLRREDVASVYKFDTKVELIQEFSASRDLYDKAYDLKAEGYTVLNDAIYKAAQDLNARPEKRRAIIVLSDGADTRSKYSSDRALKAALAADATIYTIDMTSVDTGGRERMQNQGALKNFAEKSGGRFVAAPGGTAMRDAFKNIVEELGVQYTIGYQPANPARDGKWRAIEVKTSRNDLKVRARKGYHAPKN